MWGVSYVRECGARLRCPKPKPRCGREVRVGQTWRIIGLRPAVCQVWARYAPGGLSGVGEVCLVCCGRDMEVSHLCVRPI